MYQTGTIADVRQDVLDALQGRTDVSDATVALYVARTVIELTDSYPFPQLETTGPQVALTAGQASYPVSYFMQTGTTYTMPASFVIFIDTPNNTITAPLRYKTPAGIETMTAPAVIGIPAWYTRFENQFIFGPTPSDAFTVFLRYQAKHPFSPTPKITDPLFLASSWFDIVAYGAAMRIAVLKRWTDQRTELHDMLYGDPEFINSQGKRGRPGLIAARVFQQEREEAYNSRSITPVVSRVNPR